MSAGRPAYLGSAMIVMAVGLLLTACAPTSRVTSSGGPSISEAQTIPYDGPRARITVSRFSDKSARGYADIGDGMTEMLTTSLFNTDRFILLERRQLDGVVREQELASAGRVSPGTAAPTGQIEGAELLVTGAVTEFLPGASGGGGVVLIPGINMGLGGGGQRAHVAIDIRVIDTRTSRIVAAASVEGSASDVGGGVGGVVGRELPVAFWGWKKTPMEKAIRICIQNAVDHIVSRTPAEYYHYDE